MIFKVALILVISLVTTVKADPETLWQSEISVIQAYTGEEAACIYKYAFHLLRNSKWASKIAWEPVIYYKRFNGHDREAVLYGTSQMSGGIQNFKIRFNVKYSSNDNACSTDARGQVNVFAENNEAILKGKFDTVSVNGVSNLIYHFKYDEISPESFASKFFPIKIDEKFLEEKHWGDPKEEPPAPEKEAHISPFSKKQLEEQGGRVGADVGGLVARRFFWKAPQTRNAKIVRNGAGTLLWADLGVRGYYTLIDRTDPGDVALWKAAVQTTDVVKRHLERIPTTETGKLQVPELVYKTYSPPGLKRNKSADFEKTFSELKEIEGGK